MAVRNLGEISGMQFARILEQDFGCELKWSKKRATVKVRRWVQGQFYGEALHLSSNFHSGLQRTVLHNLGFTDEEIDRLYPQ